MKKRILIAAAVVLTIILGGLLFAVLVHGHFPFGFKWCIGLFVTFCRLFIIYGAYSLIHDYTTEN